MLEVNEEAFSVNDHHEQTKEYIGIHLNSETMV
jgi:hypothetical protein